MMKNLLYHIWPVKHRGVWQWNVNQLLRRMDQFDGQRIVSVVTDRDTDTLDTVRAAFKGTVSHFIHERNDPTLGEVVTFGEMLKRVENIDPRQITFYGHAKGVKYKPGAQPMVRKWTRVMYSNMLDYPKLVEDSLQTHPIVGTFKKSGNTFGTLPPSWHYAGTFFWFRNKDIFGQALWNRIPLQWWGVEAWPGVICPQESADCLFYEGKAPGMQMYVKHKWDDAYSPAWKAWEIKHANLHSWCSYKELKTSINSRRIIVSGPQRSGTMIASKILAHDLRLPHIDEKAFETHDFNQFLALVRTKKEFVLQAPTMSPYLHQIPNTTIVFMRRNLDDIVRSQKRVDWDKHTELERDRYFDHSNDPVAVVKTRAWELFQRISLSEAAFDLDYESLATHPLWVPQDGRVNFSARQTCYPSN